MQGPAGTAGRRLRTGSTAQRVRIAPIRILTVTGKPVLTGFATFSVRVFRPFASCRRLLAVRGELVGTVDGHSGGCCADTAHGDPVWRGRGAMKYHTAPTGTRHHMTSTELTALVHGLPWPAVFLLAASRRASSAPARATAAKAIRGPCPTSTRRPLPRSFGGVDGAGGLAVVRRRRGRSNRPSAPNGPASMRDLGSACRWRQPWGPLSSR